MEIKLQLPLRDIYITQPFGVNFLDFYQNLGMKGHNGVDFLAHTGCCCFAAHSGVVVWAGEDGDGGISVQLLSEKKGDGFLTIYYHLQKVCVAVGDEINAGALIGYCDNTGKYTTGSHLHFGLKLTYDGATINKDNGYNGAINPAPYFPDEWQKTPAIKYYDRQRNWQAEFNLRFKNLWVHKQLIKKGRRPLSLTSEEVNAIVYGSWDFDIATNPAMREIYAYRTKGQYQQNDFPFR